MHPETFHRISVLDAAVHATKNDVAQLQRQADALAGAQDTTTELVAQLMAAYDALADAVATIMEAAGIHAIPTAPRPTPGAIIVASSLEAVPPAP